MKIKAGHDADRLSTAQLAFKVGERVRLSELGRQRFRRPSDKPATVVGYSRIGSAVNVIFDGVRSTGQRNTACSLSAGVSKPKVFRGR
jgi:hypothetical protein